MEMKPRLVEKADRLHWVLRGGWGQRAWTEEMRKPGDLPARRRETANVPEEDITSERR
jgi:hypothetical protein